MYGSKFFKKRYFMAEKKQNVKISISKPTITINKDKEKKEKK